MARELEDLAFCEFDMVNRHRRSPQEIPVGGRAESPTDTATRGLNSYLPAVPNGITFAVRRILALSP